MMRSHWLLMLLVPVLARGVEGVVSPLDKVTQELKEMKQTMNSVQASLITSVSLIQDQLNDFTEKIATKLESRLTSLDSKVSEMSGGVAGLAARATLWDSFHTHIESWNSQLNSLDQKVEIMRRAQDEKLNDHFSKISPLPDMNIKIEKLGVKLKDIGGQLVVMDTRLVSLQDKVSVTQESQSSSSPRSSCDVTRSVASLETLVRNLTRSQRHSGRTLRHEAGTMGRVEHTVDQIYSHLVSRDRDKVISDSPRFDYLRSEPQSPGGILTIEHQPPSEPEELEGEEFTTAEDKLLALFRRIATPFKRVNKRLMTMESLQDKIESEISKINIGIETKNDDLIRRLSEFILNSNDIASEQNRLIENYATNFASLEQCCSSQSGDLERFLVTGTSVLERLDRWSTDWQNIASMKLDRIRQQSSYDHDTVIKGQKVLEGLLVEGIEKCKFMGGGVRMARRPTTPTSRLTTTTTTTTLTTRSTTSTTSESSYTVIVDSSIAEGLQESIHHEEENLAEAESELGCEEGRSGIRSVGVTRLNEAGRDYNTRLCDKGEAGGGGWTVIQRRGDFALEPDTRVNFTRSWEDYKHGFGDLSAEFWFGNDYIHKLTNTSETGDGVTLRVELTAHDGRTAWAEYSHFRIDNEDDAYRIWIGGYSGNASDSLSAHNGYKFSTVDRNNDLAPKCCPCAPAYGGGWWFYSCFESNLNGEYFSNPQSNGYYRGIIWELWLGDYSLRETRMMIRRRRDP